MIRVLELFGGYGSQALALGNLGIEFESDLCDIDKYAEKAYNQIHGETFNYGDICSIDETKLPYYDLITYSSPCQDFSIAGKQAGGERGSGTRSSLLWECERIIRAVKPKYLLMENVKALTSKKFMPLFAKWLNTLEELGYKNYWKVLNAKDYGVPQNRERVFVVSILGGGQYHFPNPIPLTKRLKDVLEQNVDEKYYINKTLETKITEPVALDEQNNYVRQDGCVGTLTTDGSSPKHNNRVVEPLHIKENTQKGYADAYDGDSVNLEQPNSETRRGRVGHQMANTLTCSCNQGVVEPINTELDGTSRTIKAQYYKNSIANFERTDSFGATGVVEPKVMQEPINLYPNSGNPQAGRVYNSAGISPAMDTCTGGNRMPKITEHYRIRKLTPRECWRLMGVRDEQFDKLHDISNSQLYKMAGNSIVVDVLMGIFRNMFMPDGKEQIGQMSLF